MNDFEPRIIALLCRWCASAGADLAGVSRIKYPENIHPIRVNCSGRMDPLFILRALEVGADGIMLGACHPSDCHYIDGNIKMKRRFDFFMRILNEMGISERIELHYVSASEGQKFANVTKEFTEKIKKLGPTPINKESELLDIHFSENKRKKEVFFELLNKIATILNYTPTEPFLLDSSETMEGWGFPKRDPDKCIGCYTCENTCPENVITVEDINNKRTFGSFSHYCISCKKCEEACPEDALTVVDGFELMSFLNATPHPDLEHELMACSVCEKFFAPIKHIEHIEKKIFGSNDINLDIPTDHYKMCPECKRDYISNNYQSKVIKIPLILFQRRDK
jgi:F420-non-reducing hydrogenase iron-sulfur subunit